MKLPALAYLLCACSAFCQTSPEIVPLWPTAAPGSEALTFTEKLTQRSTDPNKSDRIYTQIVTPTLSIYRPENANGIAVIIAPGGAYRRIVADKEGADTALWLNQLGITAFVLKYRLPGEGHVNGQDVPLQDAQRAMRLVRARATEWKLDPQRVGFIGYSAGGHLAASVVFFADKPVYARIDAVDDLSAMPDFCILGYAAAGAINRPPPADITALTALERLGWDYKIEALPDKRYPPTFILQADDDPSVSYEHPLTLYRELKRNGTSVELHVFRQGGHGFGIDDARGPISRWPEICADWMKNIGVLR